VLLIAQRNMQALAVSVAGMGGRCREQRTNRRGQLQRRSSDRQAPRHVTDNCKSTG
jgi:hypothetical protein